MVKRKCSSSIKNVESSVESSCCDDSSNIDFDPVPKLARKDDECSSDAAISTKIKKKNRSGYFLRSRGKAPLAEGIKRTRKRKTKSKKIRKTNEINDIKRNLKLNKLKEPNKVDEIKKTNKIEETRTIRVNLEKTSNINEVKTKKVNEVNTTKKIDKKDKMDEIKDSIKDITPLKQPRVKPLASEMEINPIIVSKKRQFDSFEDHILQNKLDIHERVDRIHSSCHKSSFMHHVSPAREWKTFDHFPRQVESTKDHASHEYNFDSLARPPLHPDEPLSSNKYDVSETNFKSKESFITKYSTSYTELISKNIKQMWTGSDTLEEFKDAI